MVFTSTILRKTKNSTTPIKISPSATRTMVNHAGMILGPELSGCWNMFEKKFVRETKIIEKFQEMDFMSGDEKKKDNYCSSDE